MSVVKYVSLSRVSHFLLNREKSLVRIFIILIEHNGEKFPVIFVYFEIFIHILIFSPLKWKKWEILSFSIITIFAHRICEFKKMKNILLGFISNYIYLCVMREKISLAVKEMQEFRHRRNLDFLLHKSTFT